MPSLSDLTDYDPMGNVTGVAPEADGVRRVYITGQNGDSPEAAQPASGSLVNSVLNKLFRDDDKRYQLWPEKVVREGITAAGDVLANGALPPGLRREDFTDIPVPDKPTKDSTVLGKMLNMAPVPWQPNDDIIEKAQAISAFAGTGGLGGVTDATLGATPFLRPALKYKDRLYKGKEGQAHQDVIPDALYPEFQQMAMRGDDISHYNFGFVNDKGQFLTREKALEYGVNTGLIDPSAGKYRALTSTLLADSSKPGVAIEATAKANAPQFYSALEHNVNAIGQGKMTGDQWLGTLANKPGVKPEELQWSGLKDYLEQNKGKPVTKEQIAKHLDENKTELGEVVRGGKSDRFEDLNDKRYAGTATKEELAELETLRTETPKYSQYQVPGGENYREVLMTLPENSKVVTEMKANQKKLSELSSELEPTSTQVAELEILRARQNELRGQIPSTYKSSHWDEPNILAHMRMNDRTIDGKKSLHLEEVQSDWHQDGRKKGYSDSSKPYEVFDTGTAEIKGRYATKAEAAEAAKGNNNLDYSKSEGVPDAPFKKNWHELALKRAIREAAENGYDRLSWTAGEHHPTNPKNLNQKGPEADAADKGMQGFYNNMLPKSVEKLTGQKVQVHEISKESATKALREFEASLNSKPMTPEQKVKWNKLKDDVGQSKNGKFYYIDIPQSVKDTALGKGFPLYSSTHMFTPVAGNPFENEK